MNLTIQAKHNGEKMKENLKYLVIAIVVWVISLAGIFILNFCWNTTTSSACKEAISDVLIGLFASSLWSIPTAIVGFYNEQRRVKEHITKNLSLIRLGIKEILCDNTKRCVDKCLVEIKIDDIFKEKIMAVNINVIALIEELNEITRWSSLSALKKLALEFCGKFNNFTERVINMKGQSGEKISDKEIADVLDISRLNRMLGIKA